MLERNRGDGPGGDSTGRPQFVLAKIATRRENAALAGTTVCAVAPKPMMMRPSEEGPASSSRSHVEAAAATHVGFVREINEDSHAALDHLGLYVVADGMGGHACGDVASALAVETVSGFFEETRSSLPPLFHDVPSNALGRLIAAVKRANLRIYTESRIDPAKRGMGTTIAALYVRRDVLCVAHVGDSRVYRYRAGALERFTDDHTLANELARTHSTRKIPPGTADHVLTRALGTEPNVEVDTRIERTLPGDVVMLCSDGVWGALTPKEMAGLFAEQLAPAALAERLVARANEKGGRDNATAVVLRWLGAG